VAKLTKAEAKLHAEAIERLAQPTLSWEDRDFIEANWQESANNVNSAAGAFFTPTAMARDFALEVIQFHDRPTRVLDLCAGIGTLSRAVQWRHAIDPDLTCVEINDQYAEIGRAMVPDAKWIQADLFDLPDLGEFDVVISNPPFGRIKRSGDGPRYSGAEFEFHLIDAAMTLAPYGVFILPSGSCPFRYSGAPYYEDIDNRKVAAFTKQTGIQLRAGIGIDTSVYRDGWHGVSVQTEIVTVDVDD